MLKMIEKGMNVSWQAHYAPQSLVFVEASAYTTILIRIEVRVRLTEILLNRLLLAVS